MTSETGEAAKLDPSRCCSTGMWGCAGEQGLVVCLPSGGLKSGGAMALFIQQLINGVSLGAIYALIAIGYTMVYGIIGMINFAHGDVYMIGAFMALIGFLLMGTFG